MKISVKVALGGLVASLSLVLMLITSVIPFGTYAFPAFAGMLLILIVINIGYRYAVSVYFVTSVLSFLLAADKEAALYYAAFLGFYPIIKGLIEHIHSRVLEYLVKYAVFNLCMIAAFYIGLFILSVPKDSFNLFGVYLPWVFLILGNVIFLIYDLCITKLVTLYYVKWHKRLNKNTML